MVSWNQEVYFNMVLNSSFTVLLTTKWSQNRTHKKFRHFNSLRLVREEEVLGRIGCTFIRFYQGFALKSTQYFKIFNFKCKRPN